jgi:predicted phage terminase large subunit-like protein
VPNERFYEPRRKQLVEIGIVSALQGMIDDEYDILCISLPPGTGKTSVEKFFNSAVIGWFPKDFTLFYSHSGDITRMYYDGVYDIVTNPDEYTWGDIFPSLQVTSTNAKLEQFNIGKYKPFPSLQCTSVGSKNAGKVRASKFLLVDDMIGGIEEALNKATLEKLWNKYAVDARQRKVQDTDGKPCKEIHIATRWSTVDVIGRLQNMYADNPRVKTIAVPDIDPVTGESNFEYEYGGFTKEFFADQELLMDDISYKCLYKQQPIEREGLLYHEDELRRYMSLPLREPDAILGICDVKNKGTDFMFLPCMYKYDDDYYLVDCICDDSADYGIQYGRLTNIIIEHNMQQCEFESNNGGDRVSYEVSKRVEALGGRCNITEKATETNKETRIIVNADWVKKHILFKDKSLYKAKSDYGTMMEWLLRYSLVGKNTHDDVPDGLANFALYVNPRYEKRETKIIQGYL